MMKPVRFGVIGVKGIGHYHCNFAKESPAVELTAIADLDEDAVQAKSQTLGVQGFTDYRDMLSSGIVDAVAIATPHGTHYEMGMDCLKAGIHILVEKPLATRVSEADQMVELAKTKNLKICVGHQYRYHRTSQTMYKLIQDGKIGTIKRVLWTWLAFRPAAYYARAPWLSRWSEAGGGVMVTHCSHDLDLLCWMVGRPLQVSAMAGNQLHSTTPFDDIFCCNILFDNGAIASVQGTINQPTGYSIRQIAGDKGIIVLSDVQSLYRDRSDKILLGEYSENLRSSAQRLPGSHDQPDTRWAQVKLEGHRPFWKRLLNPKNVLTRAGILKKQPDPMARLLDGFIRSIQQDTDPPVTGESARQTLELMNAIYLSAIKKKTVTLPINRHEYDSMYDELMAGKTCIPRWP